MTVFMFEISTASATGVQCLVGEDLTIFWSHWCGAYLGVVLICTLCACVLQTEQMQSDAKQNNYL